MEQIQTLNERLEERYGKADNSAPNWRIVFSEEIVEKRLGTFDDFTREGVYLRTVTEFREVPKYKQWIHNKWILERLTVVPYFQQEELLTKLSYEPIWVFEDSRGNPLPPVWDAIELIIRSVYHSMTASKYPKYHDTSGSPEERLNRIQDLEEALWGNESTISDALAYREGIGYSANMGDKKNGNGSVDTGQAKDDPRGSKSIRQIDGGIDIPEGD